MGTNFQNEYNGIYTKIETSDQLINLSGKVFPYSLMKEAKDTFLIDFLINFLCNQRIHTADHYKDNIFKTLVYWLHFTWQTLHPLFKCSLSSASFYYLESFTRITLLAFHIFAVAMNSNNSKG